MKLRAAALRHYGASLLACSAVIAAQLASTGAETPQRSAGDEVLVVYNSRVPESKAVADHYARCRAVPSRQVVGIAISTNEAVSRAEFRDSLQRPLAKKIADERLWRISLEKQGLGTNVSSDWVVADSKIRYAVLCYGIPLKILPDPTHKDEGMEKLRPEMRRNEAAVDSELALLPLVEQKVPLSGPLRNWTYSSTNRAALHPTNNILMVCRLDGPMPEIARGLVDKAIQAETNGLWGRAYFDLRNINDPGYKLGDEWIRNAAEICKRLGFETVVDENPGTFAAAFPMSQIALYMGWYAQDANGPFAQPVVEFMPGAFAYHLHSYSAATLRSPNQHWVGPFLAKGVTITMGCVDEPYLPGTPDVSIFAARLIYQGYTFGEAAYAAQPVLSWQTTVVGDPLYSPFRKAAEQLHQELVARKSPLLQWSFLRLANLNLANGRPLTDNVSLLEKAVEAVPGPVLFEKLGDLYGTQGKPSSAVHGYLQALKYEPSPLQSTRLRWLLAEKLSSLKREPEAYAQLQLLLTDRPDYPDRLGLLRKLLTLAQALKKDDDAKRYQAEISSLTPPPAKVEPAKPASEAPK